MATRYLWSPQHRALETRRTGEEIETHLPDFGVLVVLLMDYRHEGGSGFSRMTAARSEKRR